MNRPRVLLADDHRLLREAFARLLEPECEVVGMVADGRAVLTESPRLLPHIVVLDIAMPLLNGLDTARQLRGLLPAAKVIFLTMNEDSDVAAEAFRVGASGYLLKNSAASELLQAVREVSQGRSYVTPLATQGLVENLLQSAQPSAKPIELELSPTGGAATAGRGVHNEGDCPNAQDHAPDCRLSQVQHDGTTRSHFERRAHSSRPQATPLL